MTDKNYFNSDDLYNTMEVPAVNRPRPSTADKIDDPWKLSGDGQTDEVLEFISRKLAEREKAREEAKKAEAESLIKKDSTMVMPKTEASDETELVSDSVATDDTMLIPEVKQGEVSEEKPTDETMVIPEISVSEDTVLIPEVEPTEAVTEITDDTVVIEAVEAAPERSAVSDDTIIMKKLPAIGLGQRIVSNETTAVVKKVEPKAEDNFPPDIPDDELFPEFDPFFEDDKPEENDPDATQLIPVVSAEEKPADDGRVVVKLDGPEDKIERAPAPKGRLWPPVLISSLVLIVACFVTLALGVMPVLVQNGFAKGVTQIITPVLTAGQPAANTNVLLMGVDKDGYRTDTMMVATYNVETSQITVMQLPRDTYVKNNGRQDKKLNSAYFTGVDQLKKEVNLAYGIKIHKYVEVNIDAFKKLIDAIGGVQMDVPINMIYDDPYQNLHIYLLKGPQVLDGEKAEQFVRFRKNNDGSGYPRGDLQRLEAQQAFITATVKQIVSGDGLKNINKLIKIALENVNTDMSFNEI
ncbi:MAG: LCP family protein, partial [Clostridia bacterium]|nr:LCP family protein [Clostridia bacterium]